MRETLFISDLHLDPLRPAVTAAFTALLADAAPTVDAIYILGDLFEMWIGDDDDDPFALACTSALRAASRRTAISLLHGNRDFLLGEAFAAHSGVTLLADPVVIDLYARPVLLTHGDALCIGDHAYQAARGALRTAAWQQSTLAEPLAARRELGLALRAQSRAANANKAAHIMDVDQQAVGDLLQSHPATDLVHGHTHRPGIHTIHLANGHALHRYVLGDWGKFGWVLRATPTAFRLERFVITPE